MSAIVYLKVFNRNAEPRITQICSKTKVASLKRLTIPRIQLTASLLLAKLVKYIQDHLDSTNVSIYVWADSSVMLTWISHSSRWEEFMENRVSLIHDLTQHAHWRLVPGKENPADCAFRGLPPSKLTVHKLWWTEQIMAAPRFGKGPQRRPQGKTRSVAS
ncbi:uncharacterized protein LOC107044398 [Diachasma alloeum]|uniref:uncharacterized protein LOC107044398 n=1 Tax=Diachasma alloeum TaxID=454923 RepID=UPI00073819ED|nr:uncharacterized protein LOC107044398 [Diachasma alloeum]